MTVSALQVDAPRIRARSSGPAPTSTIFASSSTMLAIGLQLARIDVDDGGILQNGEHCLSSDA